jgi:hypothetical protein
VIVFDSVPVPVISEESFVDETEASADVPIPTQTLSGYFAGGTPSGVPFVVSTRLAPGQARLLDITLEAPGAGERFEVEVFERHSGAVLCRSAPVPCSGSPGSVASARCSGLYGGGDQVAMRVARSTCSQPPRVNAVVMLSE